MIVQREGESGVSYWKWKSDYKRQRTSSPSPRTSSSTSKESDNDSGGCLLIIGLTALGACVGGPFGAFVGFLIGSYFSGND